MAYQTNSDEFFTFLQQILAENMASETVQLLSDASSSDQTLNGDLKFLKLRANKKLMVPVGSHSGPPKDQIRDVIKLVGALKSAHTRRTATVKTLIEPSKKGVKKLGSTINPSRINNPTTATVNSTINSTVNSTINSTAKSKVNSTINSSAKPTINSSATSTLNSPLNTTTSKKKRAAWPWVLLFLLLGGGAAGYFFKDKILQNEMVQKVLPEGFLSGKNEASKNDSDTPKKTKKKTSSKKKSSKPSSSSLGKYYIQIASYAKLDQALSKRKRIEMSYKRSIIVQKNIGNVPNFRVVIPGFSSKTHAKDFITSEKVNKLYNGAFAQAFSRDCRDMEQEDTNIYICD